MRPGLELIPVFIKAARTLEGIQKRLFITRTVQAISLALGTELDNPNGFRWDYGQWQRLENLMGRRPEDFPLCDAGVASKPYWGVSTYLESDQLALDKDGRIDWARDRLIEIVVTEVRKLRVSRAAINPGSVTLDRAEAGVRALFDSSKEAVLARKYEAAAERGLYRALREIREVEVISETVDDGSPRVPDEELGSSFPEDDLEHDATDGPVPGPPDRPAPQKPTRRRAERAAKYTPAPGSNRLRDH